MNNLVPSFPLLRLAAVLVSTLMITGLVHAADAVPAPGVQVEQSEGGNGVKYLLYLPTGYTDKKAWPLLVFLHGVGERGSDLEKIKAHGPPHLLDANSPDMPVLKENFIVVSPQCPDKTYWFDNVASVLGITDDVAKRFKVDTSKTYLCGLSMGGYGTWRIAANFPERWAAILPVCGGLAPAYGGATAEEIAKIGDDIPIWTHHGSKDGTVPYGDTVTITKILEDKGGAPFERVDFGPDPKGFLGKSRIFTTHVNAGHDVWTDTFNDPDTYKWLLQWSKPGA